MKNLIKKFASLGVLLIFLVGMVPLAFAEPKVVAAKPKNPIDPGICVLNVLGKCEEGPSTEYADIGEEIDSLSKTEKPKFKVFSNKKMVAKDTGFKAKAAPVPHTTVDQVKKNEKVDNLLNKFKASGWIKNTITALEKEYDEDKAKRVTKSAMIIAWRGGDKVFKLGERIKNAPEFLKDHPNALERIDEILIEGKRIYDVLEGAISDGELSEVEYKTVVIPAFRDLRDWIKDITHNEDTKDYLDYRRKMLSHRLDKLLDKLNEKKKSYGNGEFDEKVKIIEANTKKLDTTESVEEQKKSLEEIKENLVKVVAMEEVKKA